MAADKTGKKSLARRYWWILCPLVVVLIVAVPFIRPIKFNVGDRTLSVCVQRLAPSGPFAERGAFLRRGWDGPTGSFSHGDTFGIKLGKRLLRLDIVEDPLAAAHRKLPRTLSGLIETLESKDSWFRFCAFRELADMGASAQPALPALVKAVERGDSQEQGALSTVSKAAGTKSVPALTNALASRNATVRQSVAEILGEMGPDARAAIPFLEARLDDAEPLVVLQTAYALRKVDGQTHGAVAVMVKLLAHGNAEIRAGAAAVLGEFGDESSEAVPALLRTLGDASPQVRAMSARALGMIGPAARPAIPLLLLLLDDANSQVLMWTTKALGQFGANAREAIPKLARLAATEDLPARWAIEALEEITGQEVEALGLQPSVWPVKH
jgi:HEAT repeat protein